jgi:hypothetical protein
MSSQRPVGRGNVTAVAGIATHLQWPDQTQHVLFLFTSPAGTEMLLTLVAAPPLDKLITVGPVKVRQRKLAHRDAHCMYARCDILAYLHPCPAGHCPAAVSISPYVPCITPR